jgi:hypothetical protein
MASDQWLQYRRMSKTYTALWFPDNWKASAIPQRPPVCEIFGSRRDATDWAEQHIAENGGGAVVTEPTLHSQVLVEKMGDLPDWIALTELNRPFDLI